MVILYGINLSTFTRKVRLALAEKGVDYRLEIAPMGSPRVRALHPLGKIPVLEDAGIVIPDSSVIIAYLERAYPAKPLYPRGPARSRPGALAGGIRRHAPARGDAAVLRRERGQAAVPGQAAGDDAVLERAGPARDECFAYLERELAGGGLRGGRPVVGGRHRDWRAAHHLPAGRRRRGLRRAGRDWPVSRRSLSARPAWAADPRARSRRRWRRPERGEA